VRTPERKALRLKPTTYTLAARAMLDSGREGGALTVLQHMEDDGVPLAKREGMFKTLAGHRRCALTQDQLLGFLCALERVGKGSDLASCRIIVLRMIHLAETEMNIELANTLRTALVHHLGCPAFDIPPQALRVIHVGTWAAQWVAACIEGCGSGDVDLLSFLESLDGCPSEDEDGLLPPQPLYEEPPLLHSLLALLPARLGADGGMSPDTVASCVLRAHNEFKNTSALLTLNELECAEFTDACAACLADVLSRQPDCMLAHRLMATIRSQPGIGLDLSVAQESSLALVRLTMMRGRAEACSPAA
jgi:hypothetical protein